MKYWLGIALLPFAAWLLWQTYQDWQRVEAARAALPAGTDFTADDDTNPLSLAGIGEMVLPFVLAALVFSAFECIAVYRLVDGERSLSLFDMVVVLGTIAAYGLNFALKVKHRMPKTALSTASQSTGPLPWPQRLAQQREQARLRLRQPYAHDSLNKTYNQSQDWGSARTPAGPEALE